MIARTFLALVLWAGLVTVAGADEPRWRLEQPAPLAGAPFQVALGSPGSLTFWSANRGLLAVEGNEAGGLDAVTSAPGNEAATRRAHFSVVRDSGCLWLRPPA